MEKENGHWPSQKLRYMKQSSKIMESIAQKISKSRQVRSAVTEPTLQNECGAFLLVFLIPNVLSTQAAFLSIRVKLLGH